MFTATTTNKSSPRLCLLLKTLLFLLCIYIKRVATETNDTTECQHMEADSPTQQLYIFEGEVSAEISCPVREAIKQKSSLRDMVSLSKNATERSLVHKRLKQMERKIKSNLKVTWYHNGEIIHRSNGNPILQQLVTDKSYATLTLLVVSLSDAGGYTCNIEYRNLSSDTCDYFDLYTKFNFNLEVKELENYLPDEKPTISHPPTDKVIRRGTNVTFECKKKQTLSSQTTYWFKSDCSPNDSTCYEEFRANFDPKHDIYKYIINDATTDELTLFNVTESDIGYYGCLIVNNKGYDIRLAHLNLLEVELQKLSSSYNRFEEIEPNKIGDSAIGLPDQTTLTITATTTVKPLPSSTSNPITEIPKSRNVSENTIVNESVSPPSGGTGHGQLDVFEPRLAILLFMIVPVSIFFLIMIGCFMSLHLKFVTFFKDKKNGNSMHPPAPIVGIKDPDGKTRQHLPTAECPDIYNIGKTSDGFISGLLAHNNGQYMTESVCTRLLNKEKDPSISSNSNSDEASSWGKSLSSHGDNSRAFYLHTSNTTTTTVPLYDHPPSTARLCGSMVQNACVINPTYGLLRPIDSDAFDWTFPRRNLERLNKIGEGQFGEVWRYIARQKDGSDNLVAVKQLKNRVGLGDRERLELIAEIEIMKLVNDHPNVIKLLNYCADDYEPLLLIMEYAENGKLQTYLRNCRSYRKSYSCLIDFRSIITSKELVKFSYHIAKGMEYVASKGIIHRDLASRNILVSKDMVCKVADFGFARRVDDECAYERSSTNPVPVKWMAPEALVENKFTSKSDVFSFGILMWEIVTLGATPYESMASSEVYKKVTSGGRLDKPGHCKEEFYQIMASCWLHDPKQRPTFHELAAQLEKLLLSENDYIELDQYPEHAYYNILNTAEKEVVNI